MILLCSLSLLRTSFPLSECTSKPDYQTSPFTPLHRHQMGLWTSSCWHPGIPLISFLSVQPLYNLSSTVIHFFKKCVISFFYVCDWDEKILGCMSIRNISPELPCNAPQGINHVSLQWVPAKPGETRNGVNKESAPHPLSPYTLHLLMKPCALSFCRMHCSCLWTQRCSTTQHEARILMEY